LKNVPKKNRKTSKPNIKLCRRRLKVLLLAGVGFSHKGISEFLGVTRHVVYKDLRALGCVFRERPKRQRTIVGERIHAKALKFMARKASPYEVQN
jgi:hypothetical protein